MTIDTSKLYKYPIIQVREFPLVNGESKYDILIWINPSEPVRFAKGWYIGKQGAPLLDRNNQIFIPYEPNGWNATQHVEEYINNKYQAEVIELNKEPYCCSDVSELLLLKDWEKVYDSVS